MYTQSEQAEHRQKWVDALRSGAYTQGRDMLRNAAVDEYCCLGVACDISGLGQWKSNGDGAMIFVVEEEDVWIEVEQIRLPASVMKWLGVSEAVVNLSKDSLTLSTLAILNDNGVSFTEIADIIERDDIELE